MNDTTSLGPSATARLLFVAGRVPPRRPGTQTPLASAERLGRFVRDTLGGDRAVIERELVGWRDREGLALSDVLLREIAAHVARERRAA